MEVEVEVEKAGEREEVEVEKSGAEEEVESLIIYEVVVIAVCTLWIHLMLILVSLLHNNCL